MNEVPVGFKLFCRSLVGLDSVATCSLSQDVDSALWCSRTFVSGFMLHHAKGSCATSTGSAYIESLHLATGSSRR